MRRSRLISAVATACTVGVIVFSLTGCAASRWGSEHTGSKHTRAMSAALTDVRALPGVFDVQSSGGSTGVPWNVEVGIGVRIPPDYSHDITALVDYLLAEAWSTTTERPTTFVTVDIVRATKDADIADVDLAPAARRLGFTHARTETGLKVGVADMRKRYGAWPGPAPAAPAALTDTGRSR